MYVYLLFFLSMHRLAFNIVYCHVCTIQRLVRHGVYALIRAYFICIHSMHAQCVYINKTVYLYNNTNNCTEISRSTALCMLVRNKPFNLKNKNFAFSVSF